MRNCVFVLLIPILASCQVLTASMPVYGGSVACSSSEKEQSFPEQGAKRYLDISFEIIGSGRAVTFSDRAVCEYQGSICGGGKWFDVWYGDESVSHTVSFSNGEQLVYSPHAMCTSLFEFNEKCEAGNCNPVEHFELLLMFSEQRIEQEREKSSGQPINKTSTNIDDWIKNVFPDRDLVTAEELASYGYSIKKFSIAVSDKNL